MKTIENELTFFCDVDETLVCWLNADENNGILIVDPNDGVENWVRPHLPNIKVLKNKKARGCFTVIWSAGGYAWAKTVIEALELQDYVDLIMTKPVAYMDDKHANEFMGERIYLQPNSNYR